ncbi:hypothetical protein [Streptomyces sp. NPDC058595]|uniref:hypothetical protein n=1 Tax=Streptomyces sp. NPDC058595 TaxID=3346550 RepID=UPI00364A0565
MSPTTDVARVPAAPAPHTLRILPTPTDPAPARVVVSSTSPVPGLHVYQLPETVNSGDFYRWRIGHHTGLALAIAETEAHALNGANALTGLVDWTRDKAGVADALAGRTGEMTTRLKRARCFRAGY